MKKIPIFLEVLFGRQPTTAIILKTNYKKTDERLLLLLNQFEFNKLFNKRF